MQDDFKNSLRVSPEYVKKTAGQMCGCRCGVR